MKSTNGVAAPAMPCVASGMALPYAWYVSGDLIFELYEGGQPYQKFSICWEHLKPIAKLAEPPAKLSQ